MYYATSETCVLPLSPSWRPLAAYEEITMEFVKSLVVCRLVMLHMLPTMLLLYPSSTPAAYSYIMMLLIFSTVWQPLSCWSLRPLHYLLTYDYSSIILIWSFFHWFVLYSFHLLLSVYSHLGYMTPILLDFSIKASCIYSEKQQEVYSFIVHLKDFASLGFRSITLAHIGIVPLVAFAHTHCLYVPFVGCRRLIIGCCTFTFLSSI